MKKKTAAFLLLFLLASPAYASSVDVNVSNRANTSSTSTDQIKSTTNIRVETNGKVTEYNSDEPGNIEVKAVNGESEIKVNGKTVKENPDNNEEGVIDNDDISPIASASPTSTPTGIPEDKKGFYMINKILQEFNDTITKIFDALH